MWLVTLDVTDFDNSITVKMFITEKDKEKYILFLKALFKDKAYVHFVYMTGILPIAKYTSGSPLNMFHEFSSFQDAQFYPFFGLTLEEIRELMEKKGYYYELFTRQFTDVSVDMAMERV